MLMGSIICKRKAALMLCVTALFSCAPVLVSYADDAVDAIRFEQSMWDKDLLQIIEDGPYILSADLEFDIAPPPSNSGDETKGELSKLHHIAEAERSGYTLERIHYEHSDIKKAYEIFVSAGYVNVLDMKTISMLSLIERDLDYAIMKYKMHFSRPRPSQLDDTLPLVIENPPHAAYPSGHATQTYMIALVLSDFDPEHADYYKQLSLDIAHRREVAGVHYPSDSVAGRKLAGLVLDELKKDPVFSKKYEETKASFIKPDVLVNAAQRDEIRFDDGKMEKIWSEIVENGPYILPSDTVFDLPAPHKNADAQTVAELAYLKKIASMKRSDQTLKQILFEDNDINGMQDVFKVADLFNKGNFKTIELFDFVNKELKYFLTERKFEFSRARPTELDATLTSVIKPVHASYPSGNAAQLYLAALILSDFDPDNAGRYKAEAYASAERREIAGIHYPSDSEAGRSVALQIFEKLKNNPVFLKKYEDAKISYVKPNAIVEGNTAGEGKQEKI